MKKFPIRTQGEGDRQGIRVFDFELTDDGRQLLELKMNRGIVEIPWEYVNLQIREGLKSL